MDWNAFNLKNKNNFNYFDKIKVSPNIEEGQEDNLHPVLKYSAGLLLDNIYEEHNKRNLILLFPKKISISLWIAFLCTLGVMQKDFKNNPSSLTELKKGDRFLLNGCLVEYCSEEYEPLFKDTIIYVNCRDGKYGIKLEKVHQMQPVTSDQKLSSIRKVSSACNNVHSKHSKLDSILGIITLGNKNYFKENILLISKIGKTEEFIKTTVVNDTALNDLIVWGKLNYKGKTKIINNIKYKAHPSCIVASDLYSAACFLDETEPTTKAIIIDDITECLNNLEALDEIKQNDIPVFAISDYWDTEDLNILINRGFYIWHWDKKILIESKSIDTDPGYYFSFITKFLSNYVNKQLYIEDCYFPELNDVMEKVIQLQKQLRNTEGVVKEALFQLFIILLNNMSRIVYLPEEHKLDKLKIKLNDIYNLFIQNKMWLSDYDLNLIEKIFEQLKHIDNSHFNKENHKSDRLYSLVVNSSLDHIALVFPDKKNAEKACSYWGNIFKETKKDIQIFSYIEYMKLIKEPYTFFDLQIVCGWLNHKKMYKLFYNFAAEKKYFLFYPFEKKWYIAFKKKWEKQNSFTSNYRQIEETGEDYTHSLVAENEYHYNHYHNDYDLDEDIKEILDFELKIKSYEYSKYLTDRDPGEEVVKARLLTFNDGKFSFFSDNHKAPVLTEILEKNISSKEIPRKSLKALKTGDFIMFTDSNRDIIKDIADEGLKKRGKSHLRDFASLWRKVLIQKYQDYNEDFNKLIKNLNFHGCTRHPVTIKTWINNDDIIGPGNLKDIDVIASFTDNEQLKESLDDVKKAIKNVRGAHIQASSYLQKKLLLQLPEVLKGENLIEQEDLKTINLEIDDFGKITIVKIEEIEEEVQEVSIKWVNRLLSKEDDTWQE